eukprot:gb/GEZJ01000645.1/.p2 GENE.gb/GEZJ01000645.1/~~gb/GEZJ01000645.1/.p2  ORF type:complete len:217 (-),score=27.68 gb/GEZJ01000645.1/:749-1399(-)
MAFVSSFVPVFAGARAAFGARVCAMPRHSSPAVVMAEKSPSVPFMDAPSALTPDMPGYVGFDPFNISAYLNVKWLQEAEIKHARICLLAILGFIVSEVYQFPWYTDYPHLVINRHNWAVSNGSLSQILLWCSFFEIMTLPAVTQMVTGKSDRSPGDFKFDPLGLAKDPAKMAVYKVNEIKNGRLAMIAVSGAIHHAAISNQNLVEQLTSGNILPKL